MKNAHKRWRALGFKLFGPTVAPFVQDVSRQLHEQDRPVLFLMREGYHMHALFARQFARAGWHADLGKLRQLTVSRAFLFKLMLASPELIGQALRHAYKGSLESLLRNRFALSGAEMQQLAGALPLLDVELPRDAAYLAPILLELTRPLHPALQLKRTLYKEYLLAVTGGVRQVACVDIGFSGTIQTALAHLFDLDIHGYYMYLSPKFQPEAGQRRALSAQGYWSEDQGHGDGNPLIDFSLVLEGLFTAPEGQLRDISAAPGAPVFTYGPDSLVQQEFYLTYPIVQGIADFCDALAAADLPGPAVAQLFSLAEVYRLLLLFDGSPEMTHLKKLLEVDDGISGHGMIKPFNFLPGLKHA